MGIAPRLIKFNGTLDNSYGLPPGTRVVIHFALYASKEGGDPLWGESQLLELEQEARYTVFLGASETEGLPPALFSTGAARWLGVQVDGKKEQERILLVAAPYALKAADANIYAVNDSDMDWHKDADASIYTDDYISCLDEDTYDEGEITCYVDSVNGSDANDGLSEDFPVKSQSAIDSGCTVVRFKRGSYFNEKLAIPIDYNYGTSSWVSNRKVFTNYGPKSDPLPHFRVSSEPGRGPVVLSWVPLTIDGLHFSGARGDNTMEHDFDFDGDGITKGIVGGIGAFLGGAATFINNEIDDCDIGVMLGVPGSIVRGNYIHDLIMGIDDDPGVDPNLVGGAEGIFINASNCEVSYNSFVNCTGPARWVGSHGTCDGGATEVSAASGGTIENVHVHHNFSYNSCGFFEVASYFGDLGKGLFKDSTFHNNVIVDSAWMGLLQVNNTDLENIHFYNNTLIQRPGSLNEGILWIIFTAESSGMEGGELIPGTVHLTNNLYVLHGIYRPRNFLIDDAFDEHSEIFASYSGPEDANYVDLGFANIEGNAPQDFDLVEAGSPAVDAGADISGNALDYFNRLRPFGNAPDIGAMEFGSAQIECIPRFPAVSSPSQFGITRPVQSRFRPVRPAVHRRGPGDRR
jgi:hypothetical protein